MSLREQHQAGITVYYHPNPQIRSYLTAEAISSFRIEHIKGPSSAGLTAPNLHQLGPIGARLASELLQLEGVIDLKIKPNEIWVKKAESSSWEEIEDKIINLMVRALRRKQIRLVPHSSR